MATITFHANNVDAYTTPDNVEASLIRNDKGSGLGFFGGGFGISVPVNSYQDTTYVTNANGTTSGVQVPNTKYVDDVSAPNSGAYIGGEGVITGTSGIPNNACPLRITFEHGEGVRVQNCKLRIFDRNDIAKHASGVQTQIYEVRHPYPIKGQDYSPSVGSNLRYGPLSFRGISDHGWTPWEESLSMVDLTLTAGPGPSGTNTENTDTLSSGAPSPFLNWLSESGAQCRSIRHDWYIALSASPSEIGSKTDYGLYFTLEYL